MKIKKTTGLYDSFDRSGRETRATHYCPGCGHGILHKLIAETLAEYGVQDRTIFISPIGCAVFGYYYMDCGNINAAHGRAPAVATALARTLPHALVISYQGDGDLGAIGFNNCFQAALRGERMVTFFVNNATYGMTGGQMAPTSLIGQVTATSPYGRSVQNEGHPLHVCEVLNQLQAPVYIERCSLADTKRIMAARRAVRKALDIQREGKGYAIVEFLAPCPTAMNFSATESAHFVADQMEKEFPLGCFRDRSADAHPAPKPPARVPLAEYFARDSDLLPPAIAPDHFPEQRLKFAGFGGQGILSLGLVIADAGRRAGRHSSWFPNYGPEQRGGAASCSVVISSRPIGSPLVERPGLLMCMNRPAYERFAPDMAPGGWILCDALVPADLPTPEGVHRLTIPATEIATRHGMPKAANTFLIAVLAHTGLISIPTDHILHALEAGFRVKPALVAKNRKIFEVAQAWCLEHLGPPGLPRSV